MEFQLWEKGGIWIIVIFVIKLDITLSLKQRGSCCNVIVMII